MEIIKAITAILWIRFHASGKRPKKELKRFVGTKIPHRLPGMNPPAHPEKRHEGCSLPMIPTMRGFASVDFFGFSQRIIPRQCSDGILNSTGRLKVRSPYEIIGRWEQMTKGYYPPFLPYFTIHFYLLSSIWCLLHPSKATPCPKTALPTDRQRSTVFPFVLSELIRIPEISPRHPCCLSCTRTPSVESAICILPMRNLPNQFPVVNKRSKPLLAYTIVNSNTRNMKRGGG